MAGLSSVFFVVSVDEHRIDEIRRRADRLFEFYSPLGVSYASVGDLSELSLLVGEYRLSPAGRPEPDVQRATRVSIQSASMTWGGPFPSWLDVNTLLHATDGQLRSLDSTATAFAAHSAAGRLVSGCAGATSLYSAAQDGIDVWSTHAVAAGYLARGAVDLDHLGLPELFAAEFVGGDRTQLVAVRALPRATAVEFTPRGHRTRSYWPEPERHAVLCAAEARESADRTLVESLDRRLPSDESLELGLTAGADSRVAAVALHEAGRRFEAVTVAPPQGSRDSQGASRVAGELGVPHRVRGYSLVPDERALEVIDAEVRWSEGLTPLNGFAIGEPEACDVVVTGGGGEVARAWYYRWQARNYRRPTREQLACVLSHLHWRIPAASHDAHRLLDDAILGWIDSAIGAGHTAWSALDLVYDEQRVRRWGRALLPRSRAPLLYAFSTPELTQAFLSLPLEDRISDGFHYRFLARHAPAVAVERPRSQRRGIPRVVRRHAARMRGRRSLARSPLPPGTAEMLKNRLRTRAYVTDDVLERAFLRDVMGTQWLCAVRSGFAACEEHAVATAFRATALAALETAISELNGAR